MWHRSDSRIGLEAGLAPALQVGRAWRVSRGGQPELLLQVGRCCKVYPFVSVRWDRSFSGAARDQLSASVGLGYW